jgi:hypothetical protein
LKKKSIGMRWRTKMEVFEEKGFRVCGNLDC